MEDQPNIISITAAAGHKGGIAIFGLADDGQVYVWDNMQGRWQHHRQGN